MDEEESLLEYMLQEAGDIQNQVALPIENVKELLLEESAEELAQLEKYTDLTVKDFLKMAAEKEDNKRRKEAEALFQQKKTVEKHNHVEDCMVFGEEPDGTIRVYFEEDDAIVRIIMTPPKAGGKKIAETMLQQVIKDCGISYGIREKYVRRLSKTPVYDTSFVIAKGISATEGEDGIAEFQFDPEKKLIPKIDPLTGIIDYKELAYVKDVKEGDILCRIKKPTAGIEGIDVFGKAIKGKIGKKVNVEAGKNTKIVEEETEYNIIATCNGEVHYADNKIFVDKILVIDHVDAAKGNINFIGTIYVKGNVYTGFTIKASGNLIINGVVEEAKLSAGGDIVVHGGIKGSGTTEVNAKGAISALFIENANIFAKKNIYADYVLNSNLESEQKISLSGKHGFLIGGKTKAVEIVAVEIGNSTYTLTELEVAYPQSLLTEIANTKEELEECQEVIEKLEKRSRFGNPQEAQLLAFRTRMTQKRVENKLAELEGRLQEIKQKTTIGIYAEQKMYPNVAISMEKKNYNNKELKRKCAVRKIDGKWKIRY